METTSNPTSVQSSLRPWVALLITALAVAAIFVEWVRGITNLEIINFYGYDIDYAIFVLSILCALASFVALVGRSTSLQFDPRKWHAFAALCALIAVILFGTEWSEFLSEFVAAGFFLEIAVLILSVISICPCGQSTDASSGATITTVTAVTERPPATLEQSTDASMQVAQVVNKPKARGFKMPFAKVVQPDNTA